MNGLSLRVSAIRNGENLKKNSEIRVSVLRLPAQHSFESNTSAENRGSEFEKLKHDFETVTSIDQQLVTIRRCFTTLSPDISSDELSAILQLLCDIFFFAPRKHPVRNAIAKLLQKGQLFHGLTTKCLVNTILGQQSGSIDEPLSAPDLNALVISIGGCLDNFPIAQIAVKICVERIFAVVQVALQVYLSALALPQSSPAARSELYIFVHSAVRLSLAVVQLCFDQMSTATIEPTLQRIANQCRTLIGDVDVPMDTKVNCGQYLLLHAKLFDGLDEMFAKLDAPPDPDGAVETLVLCVGTINTINDAHLAENDGCHVLRNAVAHLVAIATANAIEQNVLIAATRGLVQCSKVLLQFKLSAGSVVATAAARGALQALAVQSLDFVWTFAEHYLDSVRHLSRDLLCNLLKLAHKHGQLFAELIERCAAVARNEAGVVGRGEYSANVQCLAIDQLGKVCGAEIVIARCPSVIDDVLIPNLSEPNWAACYDRLMAANSRDLSTEAWFVRWVQPILALQQPPETLISSAIRSQPDCAATIVAAGERLPIKTYLFVVWTVRKNGLQSSTIGGFRPAEDSLVAAAMVHSNDDIRIMPLRILVDVPRTTEPFSAAELNAVLRFLHYNCNCQCPSMRMQIVAQMTKAFLRIDASHAVAHRNGATQTCSDNVAFLLRLRDRCVRNLFDGANFSRRSIALNLLLQSARTLQNISALDGGSAGGLVRPEAIWPQRMRDTLRRVVEADTYESNKLLAIEVLRCCPMELNPHADAASVVAEQLQRMLTSIRPAESLSGAYLMELCCMFGWHFDSIFTAIEWCERLLLDGLRTARSSLLLAARQNPMYGLVFCIKHLIGRADLKTVPAAVWRPFLVRFIDTCEQLLAVVAPIVNSSSPEGLLPDGFNNGEDGELSGIETSAQMVLLCAWRTVKEVSLLLGELSLHATIQRVTTPTTTDADQTGLLRIEDILHIGRRFQLMLAETKHRGAFEQAYVGFSKLCVRLWRSNEPALHRCPMRWLRMLIDLIASNETAADEEAPESDDEPAALLSYEHLCATRRSAGVPFMIQALITSELQVCSSAGLQYSMRRLLALCRRGASEETRTHALNILRALFRCTDLGDAVAEFVADGLEVAIGGYAAATWPERNSATLLFAALMTRIFGVQRHRQHAALAIDSGSTAALSVRNRMTGRIFFLRYPQLYDFMAQQLRVASASLAASVADRRAPAQLHPLLLLLGRLYPSALEGCESSLQLTAFLPAVLECSVCPELETRRLAVRSMTALLAPGAVMEHVDVVLELMRRNRGAQANAMHGYLLQISELVRSMTTKQANDWRLELERLWWALLELDDALMGRLNGVLVSVFVEILNAIVLRVAGVLRVRDEKRKVLDRFEKFVEKVLLDRRCEPFYAIGRPEAVKSCVLFKVLLSIKSDWDAGCKADSFILYRNGIPTQSFEYIETVLNVMQLILNAHERNIARNCDSFDNDGDEDDDDDCDEYEFTAFELAVVSVMTTDQIASISKELKKSLPLKEELLQLTRQSRFYPVFSTKAFSVLSQLNVTVMRPEEILELLSFIDGKPDNVRNAVLKWVTVNLPASADDVVLRALYQRLREATDPNALDKLRVTAAICLCRLKATTWLHGPADVLLEHCDLLVILLRDDHYYVRQHIARYVQQLSAQSGAPVISIRAEEMFVQWLHEEMMQPTRGGGVAIDAVTFWTELLDRQLHESQTDEIIADATEMFNKNEANLFGEKFNTARRLYGALQAVLPASGGIEITLKYHYLEDSTLFDESPV